MYPYDIDPRSYINSALALQTPTGAGMPQMTPAYHSYYGPTHQALSDTLAAALARQASNAGLFALPTTPGVSGGLLAPAGTTPSASFFRMPSDFSKPVYIPPVSTPAAPSTGVSNTAQTSSGGGHNGPSQPIYSSDFTRSNGPVGTQYGFTGPYDNGGGPGNSFVDGTFFGGIGNFFNSLFNPAPPPTSIDALGSDTKTTAEAPAPTYRLSSNDLMGGLGPQASITGTPLAPPSNDMMPGIGAQPSITGTDIGTPMQEPSQTLNGLLTGNYEPVTGYSNNFSPLTSADLTPAPNADVSQTVTAPNADVSQAVTAPTPDSKPFSIGQALLGLLTPDIQPSYPRAGPSVVGSFDTNAPNTPVLTQVATPYISAAPQYPAGQGIDPTANQSQGEGDSGGDGGGDGGGGGDSRGGPITKKKLFGNKPNNGDDGWGTLKQGEYVIRPESVKVLPPGLLSALNNIYKSPNPKKTLRGLLG